MWLGSNFTNSVCKGEIVSKVLLVALVLGGCLDWSDKEGSVAGAEIKINTIGEQKLGTEFAVGVKIQIDGETVTTGDIAVTAVVVQWKCAEEEYTDDNKIEAKTANGTVEVKITIGEIDDEVDKKDCIVKVVAQIADEEIDFESPAFSVTAHKIEITLADDATLGITLSDTFTAIKFKNEEIKLHETSISLGEGCQGMRLIHWSDTKVEEVESALADADDVYVANGWAGLDENCLLQLKNSDGEAIGSARFSLSKTAFSIAAVASKNTDEEVVVSLGEGELTERTAFEVYFIYDEDSTKNELVESTSDVSDNKIKFTVDFNVDKDALPDKFYLKLQDKVFFLLYEPTIAGKIIARDKEGGKFSVEFLFKDDKLTLEGATDQVKCAARLYQVSETAVSHPVFIVDVGEERDEDFPGITVAKNGNVSDLFVVGNPENCALQLNGEAIGSFASNPQGSGAEVEVGYKSVGESPDKYDVVVVTTSTNISANSTVFVLDGGYYKVNVSPEMTEDGKRRKWRFGGSPPSITALVRTGSPIDGIVWLMRAYKPN